MRISSMALLVLRRCALVYQLLAMPMHPTSDRTFFFGGFGTASIAADL